MTCISCAQCICGGACSPDRLRAPPGLQARGTQHAGLPPSPRPRPAGSQPSMLPLVSPLLLALLAGRCESGARDRLRLCSHVAERGLCRGPRPPSRAQTPQPLASAGLAAAPAATQPTARRWLPPDALLPPARSADWSFAGYRGASRIQSTEAPASNLSGQRAASQPAPLLNSGPRAGAVSTVLMPPACLQTATRRCPPHLSNTM